MPKTHVKKKLYAAMLNKAAKDGLINDPDGKMITPRSGPTSKTDEMSLAGSRKRHPSRTNHNHPKVVGKRKPQPTE